VDEVLAVGDAEFQKKAVGKMEKVSKDEGRTILFVSHNLEAVKSLCTTGILLINGTVSIQGETKDVIQHYIQRSITNTSVFFENFNHKSTTEWQIQKAWLSQNSLVGNTIYNDHEVELFLEIVGNNRGKISFEVILRDKYQHPILFSPLGLIDKQEHILEGGKYKVKLTYNFPYLAQGRYFLDLIIAEAGKKTYDLQENALYFNIESTYINETSWSFYQERGQGCVLQKGKSEIVYEL